MDTEDDSTKNQRKIGKGSPPPGWKKGQSGNPKGKPKGTLNRSTIVNKWLDVQEMIQNPLTKKMQKLSQEDLITLAQISQARKGNVRSYLALKDDKYGKQTVQVEVDANIIELDWNKIGEAFDKVVSAKKKNGSLKQTPKESTK
ncbi:hypothetical protein [Leptospira phage LE4]|uniref:DUF5681 domain-containing protein n=1 Tax=Leptospira phage LE4 TaxID=2041383 RepID=A0A343LEC1_9CAUD|nr:hypothetical protein HWB34_gp18 [Leptospira phage LE4]ATN95031.1 hypothetical protein [Leptospira phage LE4]